GIDATKELQPQPMDSDSLLSYMTQFPTVLDHNH
ncbi:hypothetical protein A2U01_0097056, partial [Trifolium medium]|nr:hypothetical protein [Trifolium medium]